MNEIDFLKAIGKAMNGAQAFSNKESINFELFKGSTLMLLVTQLSKICEDQRRIGFEGARESNGEDEMSDQRVKKYEDIEDFEAKRKKNEIIL